MEGYNKTEQRLIDLVNISKYMRVLSKGKIWLTGLSTTGPVFKSDYGNGRNGLDRVTIKYMYRSSVWEIVAYSKLATDGYWASYFGSTKDAIHWIKNVDRKGYEICKEISKERLTSLNDETN